MFKCFTPHSTMSFMSARCHRFLDITSTFLGVNGSLLKDTNRRGRYRTLTSRFGVRNSTPRPPRSLEYMLTCGTKGHYILPLSDLSKALFMCAICIRVQICTWDANLHPGCIFGHVNGVLRICTWVQICTRAQICSCLRGGANKFR